MKRFTVSFFVRTATKDKDKKVNIKVRVSAGRGKVMIEDARLLVAAGDWKPDNTKNDSKNTLKGKAALRGDNIHQNDKINSDLIKLQSYLEDLLREDLKKGNIRSNWLKVAIDKYYNREKYKKKEITLFTFIQDFIDKAETRINPRSGRPVSYKMVREYERTFYYLKQYAKAKGKKPNFKDIDLDFYDDFIAYLQTVDASTRVKSENGKKIKQKLSTNTIGKKIQTLKVFLNDATERGINQNFKFKSNKFISVTEVADTFYLNEDELKKFYEHDFSEDERLEKVRDLFIVGCWTGLRFSDLSCLSPENIKNGYFHVTQKKTEGKVIIPIHPTVQAILNKYNGDLPKAISNQKFNDYLREAAKEAEIDEEIHKAITRGGKKISKKYKKHEVLTTHAARRSFATNLYKSGFPSQSIMAITGHKTETAFLKYLKVTAEEHAQLLLNHWQKNLNHLKVV